MNLQIVNPLEFPNWDELLLANQNTNVFHSARWTRVLNESYGYQPLCLTSFEKGAIDVLLPFMEIRSAYTGRRAVSLPFTDYCEPILAEGVGLQDVLGLIIQYGLNARWSSIELRGIRNLPAGVTPSSAYCFHNLDLTKGEKALKAALRRSTWSNVRKSARLGTSVTMNTSRDAVRRFYDLHCITRKLHGLPPPPFSFFEMIHRHLLSQDRGAIALASHAGKVIAGAVFLHFGDKAVYKYAASDRCYQHLRANNLVLWSSIVWHVRRGFRSLSFGRSEPRNDGLLQFKRGWGAAEEMLYYARYDLERSVFVSGSPRISGFHNSLIRAMPVPLLRLVGALVYRHVG